MTAGTDMSEPKHLFELERSKRLEAEGVAVMIGNPTVRTLPTTCPSVRVTERFELGEGLWFRRGLDIFATASRYWKNGRVHTLQCHWAGHRCR